MEVNPDTNFGDVLQGLQRGDFSRLEPVFEPRLGARPQIVGWVEEGRFGDQPLALAEALTCACFLGKTEVAEYLLARGADPSAGIGTGLSAFQWAANRGQLETVRLLVGRKVPLETRSMYGGTVLGTAMWAAINEPKPDHLQIIEELLDAGASIEDVGYPTESDAINAVVLRHTSS